MAHQRVLLVGDTPDGLAYLEHLLGGMPLETAKTLSSDRASLVLQAHDAALMLMGTQAASIEILECLHSDGCARHVPAVLIFEPPLAEAQLSQAYQAGAVDCLCGPIEPELLQGKISAFCELARQRESLQARLSEVESRNESLRREMTERRRAEEALLESELRYRSLVELSPESLVVLLNGSVIYINTSLLRLLGLADRVEIIDQPLLAFFHPEYQASVRSYLSQIEARGGQAAVLEAKITCPDGRQVDVEVCGAAVRYESQTGVLVAMQDITERKRLEGELRRLSQQDGLTGVPNRRAFDERLTLECRRAMRNRTPLSLLMIDIDFFKAYNDEYGHPSGDQCLKKVASALRESLGRTGDLLARYGGEEFAVILPDTPPEGALHVAEEMRRTVEQRRVSHITSATGATITVSLGVATIVPTARSSCRNLLKEADRALYQAKKAGRNRVESCPTCLS